MAFLPLTTIPSNLAKTTGQLVGSTLSKAIKEVPRSLSVNIVNAGSRDDGAQARAIAALPTRGQRLRAFVATIADALENKPEWVNTDVMLAQSVLETGWFTSNLFKATNNAYGMGANPRGISTFPNSNYPSFANYRNIRDSAMDYVARQQFFNDTTERGRRRNFSGAKSVDEYLSALNTPGNPGNSNYAEAPGYNAAIKELIPQIKAELTPSTKDDGELPQPVQQPEKRSNALLWVIGIVAIAGIAGIVYVKLQKR